MVTKGKDEIDELLGIDSKKFEKQAQTRKEADEKGKQLGETTEVRSISDAADRALNPELQVEQENDEPFPGENRY